MFQPSAYSLPASLTVNGEFAGMDYGADWRLKNVFSKKGRAENQKARAEYNRERAKKTDSKFFKDWRNRRGDRFEMKSAQLKMEAEGKEPIAPTPGNSDKLWVQPYPWGRREERRLGPALLLMRSKTMEDAAKGYKPGYQLINSEYRATILGGVYILKYAMDATTGVPGYAPYTMMTPETIEIRGVGKKFDDQLIGFAKRGAREAGAPEPKNLKSAAEFIRKEVEARGLARPAWSHRALLIVAMASKKMIVIADETKLVEILGKFPLPLEVVPFGLAATRLAITRAIEASGCRGELTIRKRATGEVWLTDSGNVILDAALGTIPAPEDLAERLDSVTALVEHGLFIGIAKTAILATSSGIKTMSV